MYNGRFFKTFATMTVFAAAGVLAGCSMGENNGVPLGELDLTGEAPHAVALFGPDRIIITEGAPFRVTAEGEGADTLRFSLKDGTLGVSRGAAWLGSGGDDAATVRITMPAPRSLTLIGSGHMTSPAMADEAGVTVAGSGILETPQLDVKRLDASIAGSGDYIAGGRAGTLKVSIAGSGNARMEGLKADEAEVNIAGSGNAGFASDGEVRGNIMGSGNVTVSGTARCNVKTMGSGTLKCQATAAPAG